MRRLETEIEAILPDLWRYAFSLTRDGDQADDLVQDCVERALRKRRLLLPGRPSKPWLMTMLLNLYRNGQRASARRSALVSEADPPAPNASAEDRLELNSVLARIDALPTEMKDPLLLVVVGGLSYAEAAATLEIPLGTVMSRISRARARLKQAPPPPPNTLRSVK